MLWLPDALASASRSGVRTSGKHNLLTVQKDVPVTLTSDCLLKGFDLKPPTRSVMPRDPQLYRPISCKLFSTLRQRPNVGAIPYIGEDVRPGLRRWLMVLLGLWSTRFCSLSEQRRQSSDRRHLSILHAVQRYAQVQRL